MCVYGGVHTAIHVDGGEPGLRKVGAASAVGVSFDNAWLVRSLRALLTRCAQKEVMLQCVKCMCDAAEGLAGSKLLCEHVAWP